MDMGKGGMDHGGHGGGGGDHHATMHMTFFWGSNAEILFSGWPGSSRPGMYALAIVFVFFLAVLVEYFSHCRLINNQSSSSGNRVAAALVRTLLHALRVGLAYLAMLAVMSFNVGVFIAAVAGHALGFLVFGSRLFKSADSDKPSSDLPPMSC